MKIIFNLVVNIKEYLKSKIVMYKPKNKKQGAVLIVLIIFVLIMITALIQYFITKDLIYPIIIYTFLSIEILFLAVIDKDMRSFVIKLISLPTLVLMTLLLSMHIALILSAYGSAISGIDVEHWLGYFGAVIGAGLTILGSLWILYSQRRNEKYDKNQVLNLIVDNILRDEIQSNLMVIKRMPGFSVDTLKIIINQDELVTNNEILTYYYDVSSIDINAYTELKYDLIKYDNTKLIIEILDIYKMFNLFIRKRRLLNFSKEQLIFIKDTYSKYEKKYVDDEVISIGS